MARESKRGIVLDTAERLFIQDGFTATGINQITREAEIASMTLYNNFRNKNELILSVLDRTHQQMIDELDSVLEDTAGSPSDRMLAIFSYLREFAEQQRYHNQSDESFTGNLFNHAAAEFRPLSHPIHQATVQHKQYLLDLFQDLAEEMGNPNPEALAKTLIVLVDGAFTSAQVMNDLSLFQHARNAAEALIQQSN